MTNHKFPKGKQNRKSFDILFSLLRRRIIGPQPKLLTDTVFLCLQRIYIYGDQIRLFNNMLFLFCHFLWCDCSWFCDCGWGKFLLISLWKWYSLLQSGQAAEINMDWYSNGELRKKVHCARLRCTRRDFKGKIDLRLRFPFEFPTHSATIWPASSKVVWQRNLWFNFPAE